MPDLFNWTTDQLNFESAYQGQYQIVYLTAQQVTVKDGRIDAKSRAQHKVSMHKLNGQNKKPYPIHWKGFFCDSLLRHLNQHTHVRCDLITALLYQDKHILSIFNISNAHYSAFFFNIDEN